MKLTFNQAPINGFTTAKYSNNSVSFSGETAAPSTTNPKASGFDTYGTPSKFFNKKVIGTVAGIVILGGLGYYFLKDKQEAEKHPSKYIA